ncbi:hypothetical protein H0B56_03235 [Haloechinothrix sp. YIM 98757]|uniref:Uncharacterized protein n=1 Tax=Haloechinothrix aidingensis TaxID=2752311 RepID=A0A838A638_9PSEU|nr:hypothetical protein [Haloechinothrix aidingensis]MBA0124548.1 hypothetical protein [Haloechinothrix aidingensis]
MEPSRETLLEMLAEGADFQRPRLFALYRLTQLPGNGELEPLIGWGMDFPDDLGTVFYCPDSRNTWYSQSAERLLHLHRRFGEAHLVWLDDRPGGDRTSAEFDR